MQNSFLCFFSRMRTGNTPVQDAKNRLVFSDLFLKQNIIRKCQALLKKAVLEDI